MLAAQGRCGQILGVRYESVWSNFFSSIENDLKDDKTNQIWFEGLQRDPLVKLTAGIVNEALFYGKTAINAGTAIAKTAALPITYPLSKIIKKQDFKLTKCPFPPAKTDDVSAGTELMLKKLNIFEKIALKLKNTQNSLSISKNPLTRAVYSAAEVAVSVPVKYFTEPSQEQLVVMAIQGYYPTFNIAEFTNWIKSSFLPVLIERYLRGNVTLLEEVASQKIVKERRLAILEFLNNRLIIRSRLLDITEVNVLGYDFGNRMPSVLVKCGCDHTNEVKTMRNKPYLGGPDEIQHTDFMVALSVDASGEEPRWIATEITATGAMNRI